MTNDSDMTGGLKVAFDGHRLILKAPAAMTELAITPQQWANLLLYVETLRTHVFTNTHRRTEGGPALPQARDFRR